MSEAGERRQLFGHLQGAIVCALPDWWVTTISATLSQIHLLSDRRREMVNVHARDAVLWDLTNLIALGRDNGAELERLRGRVENHGVPREVRQELLKWLPPLPSGAARRIALEETHAIDAAWAKASDRLRWMQICEGLLPLSPAPPAGEAPVELPAFLKSARPLVTMLAADLLAGAAVETQKRLRLRNALEGGDHFESWLRSYVGQVAAAWVLSCVYVRMLEDRGLIGRRLAGPGAVERMGRYMEMDPTATETDYLLTVWRELAASQLTRCLFTPGYSPVWLLAPTGKASRELLAFFRSPQTGSFGQPDTRFLGDLYQELNAEVVERFALVQTPDFVESFILDRTLEPAVERFGIGETDVIDPTCGCGHFLVSAFERLYAHLVKAEPDLPAAEAARRAVEAAAGVDINPVVVAIARFRLHLAYLGKLPSSDRQGELPRLNVVVADALLRWGPADWRDYLRGRAVAPQCEVSP